MRISKVKKQNGQYQVLTRMWSKKFIYIAGGIEKQYSHFGKWFGSFLIKLNIHLSKDPTIHLCCSFFFFFFWHQMTETYLPLKTGIQMFVSSFICPSPKLETTWMPFSAWKDKLGVLRTQCDASFLSNTKSRPLIHMGTGMDLRSCAECEKPVSKSAV